MPTAKSNMLTPTNHGYKTSVQSVALNSFNVLNLQSTVDHDVARGRWGGVLPACLNTSRTIKNNVSSEVQ